MCADDLSLPDTRLLRLLDLLYDTRSVTRAAEHLGLSQPTVSIWLAQLRAQYGDPLFVRTPSGMAPTPRADAMIGPAREALDAMRRLGRAGADFDPATSTRHFRIGMTDASHITLLPPWLAQVRVLAPSVRLSAARIDDTTAQALAAGEVDLAVGLVPWLEAGFYQQTLYPQDWVCLVNARHPRLGATIDLAAYEAEAHVGIAAGTGARLLAQALADADVQRQVLLELPGFLGLGAILSTTDLVATLPRQIGETLARTNGLRVLACPVAIPGFTVKQHWHARYHHDAGNRWLRGVCAALFLRPQANPP
ncbi:LysR family transcriptional regulator [Sphaerotilus sp.]|uniref:LysR family transcriptional regulator n=1 Tax=Sphaerotilus sp. TaxID=2093942 RepID=UPI0034E1984F